MKFCALCGAHAVAVYISSNSVHTNLCETALNFWLDNADDDDELEPIELRWLTATPLDMMAI